MAAECMQSHDQSCGNWPTASQPATKKGRINAPILPKPARCAKSDRLLEFLFFGAPRRRRAARRRAMELLHRRCCGLDVHKDTVVACLRLVSNGKVTTEVRTFRTITADLLKF